MARKYFEQMLLEELELGNYPGFQRWYMGPNPFYYSFCEMNQDYRNVTRLDRYDLYSFDYYRQPYWVNPQNLAFPNYEQFCLYRRNDKRGFYNKKHHLPRDKRSTGEKRSFPNRHDDGNSYRIERGKSSDFRPHVEKRYPPGWNHEPQHYPVTRDDRNTPCLSYRSSNMNLNADNIMMDQHLQNLKQMFESRNSSTDCLPVNENLTQSAYTGNENAMHVNSPVNSYKATDIEWKDQVDKVSKNNHSDESQASTFQNFTNNYASWYCPEEQQQIIDMLKEVNLRHDRQLKRDMHLTRNGQTCSDESVTSNNDSQMTDSLLKFSLSSEDSEDDGIVIHLSPGTTTCIPELATEDEDLKSAYHEKSASDFFEEFQNIFTSSPERKTINSMTKEILQKSSQPVYDDDPVAIGRVITEDDKNAVKAVLDFDHIDDTTQKTVVDSCSHIYSSSPKETQSECHSSTNNSENQNTSFSEILNHDDANREFSKNASLNIESNSLKSDHADTYSCSDKANPNHNSLKQQQLQHNSTNFDLQGKYRTSNSRDVKKRLTNFASNMEECSFHCSWTAPLKTKDYANGSLKKKENELDNAFQSTHIAQSKKLRFPRENSYNNIQHVEKNLSDIESRSFANAMKYTASQNNTKIVNPNNVHKHIPSNSRNDDRGTDGIKTINDKKNVEILETVSFSNKEAKKEDSGLSISEPFLTHRPNDVVYKRISLSEIFSNASFQSEEGLRKNPNKHKQLPHLTDQNLNLEKLSPTEHLKQILGIGGNCNKKPVNIISVSASEEKNRSNEAAFLKELKLKNSLQFTSNKSEDIPKVSKKMEQQKYSCCMQTNVSLKKTDVLYGDHLISPEDTSHSHSSKNPKSTEKNTKSLKIKSSPVDPEPSSYIPPKEPRLQANVQHLDSKHRSELQNSQMNLNTNNSLDKRGESTKKESNQGKVPEMNKMSEVTLKSKHKSDIDVHTKFHKSLQQDYKSYTSEINENESNKFKKEHSKTTSSKNDKKKRFKEVSSPTFLDDSQLSVSGEKDHDELLIFKPNSAKSKKKFKKKRKEKFTDEFDNYETKQSLSQSNRGEQNPKENCHLRDVSKNIPKYKKSKKKEIIDEIFNHSTSVKCDRNIISNDKDKIQNDSTNEAQKSYFKNSNDKMLNSLNKDHNSTYDSNLTPSEAKKNSIANFSSRKPVLSYKLKDNTDKSKHYSKGYDPREGKSHWKSKIRGNDQHYPSEDKEEYVSARNCFKQNKEQQNHKNSTQVAIGSNCNKESKNSVSNNDEIQTKNGELKNIQSSKNKECAKEKENSISHSGFSSSTKQLSYPGVVLYDNEPVNGTRQRASSNTTSRNKVERSTRPVKDAATNRSNFADPSLINSAFRATVSTNKSKTRQMLDEAKEISWLLEKRRNESGKQKQYYSNRRCSGPKNCISTEFSSNVKCNDSYSYSEQVKNISPNSFLCNSMRNIDTSAPKRLKDKICSDSLYKYCHRNDCDNKNMAGKRTSGLNHTPSTEPKKNEAERLVSLTPQTSVLVITPKAMYKYLRNKAALKLNRLLDVHVQTHISDLLYELKQSPDLEKCFQLSLASVISKKLLHTLPVLLNLLSLLSALHIPWSRNGLKKLLEVDCPDKETQNLELVKSHQKEKIQNYTNEILNCWDILSNHLTNERAHNT